jgi:uncharacterized protein
MKIGLISDTHNQRARTRAAVEIFQREGVQALIHCGDFLIPEIVEICSVIPFHFVFGNNDGDMAGYLAEAATASGANCLGWRGTVELAGKKLAVTHGHLTGDIRHLLAEKPDYLFTGHSHVVHDFVEGPTRLINPGALHRASEYTIATLDLVTGELRVIGLPI